VVESSGTNGEWACPGDSGGLWRNGSVAHGIHFGTFVGSWQIPGQPAGCSRRSLYTNLQHPFTTYALSLGTNSWSLLTAAHATSKCADVQWGVFADGADLWLYPCDGNTAQQFHMYPIFDGSNDRFEFRRGGRYGLWCWDLDIAVSGPTPWGTVEPGWANPNPVQQWSCNSGGQQQFRVFPTSSGRFRIETVWSARNVEVQGGSSATYTPIGASTYSGFTSEQWRIG